MSDAHDEDESKITAARYHSPNFGCVEGCDCHPQRNVIAAIGANGMAAAVLPATAKRQTDGSAVQIIDVHHHIYPPRYRNDNRERIIKDIGSAALAPLFVNWSPEGAIKKMDQAGVATAINSISSPGVWFDDGEAGRDRARECNEFGAQLMRDFPARFGMFAAIPLPDAEGSLREIEYALDVLKLDGVGMLTSYAGKMLGDPMFAPVLDELNQRKSVVFVHPTMSCCGSTIPEVGPTILEFPMDTTRAIASLLIGGSFARYSEIRFIFPHGGGMLVPVINRIVSAAARMAPEERAVRLPNGPEYELQRQFYDVASIGFNLPGFEALRKLFPASQLLFGSDEPFNSTTQMANSLQKMDLPPSDRLALLRGNAQRLLPRLQI
jgi:predicted TIM-barrel fold metal-dependent hydrolase